MIRRQREIARCSLRLLVRHPLRSTLLALSAALGVAGVVCSANYEASGSAQMLDQIRRMGTNVLIVTPAQSRAIAGRARTGQPVTTLMERDLIKVRREVPSILRSSAVVTSNFWLKAGDLSKNAAVVGCEPEYFPIRNWDAVNGTLFNSFDNRAAARVALLGSTAARDLFGSASPIGSRLLINRVPFTVIGVLAERGQGLDVTNEDSQVYVPLTTAMRRLMNVDHYSGIALEVDSRNEIDDAAGQLRDLLRELHHIRPGQPDDFQVQNQKALLETQELAARKLNLFLRWIAASALVVSALGMLGITWIAVRERTREFGVRRALGASAGDIFFQVACESATLALLGCVAGVLFSLPTSRLISEMAKLPLVMSKSAAPVAFGVSALLNIMLTLWPARRAARLDPTEALRYE